MDTSGVKPAVAGAPFFLRVLGGKRQSGTASLMRGPSQVKSSQVKSSQARRDTVGQAGGLPVVSFFRRRDLTTWPLFCCVRPAAPRLSGGQSTLGRRIRCWPMPGLCWCARWLRRGVLWDKVGRGGRDDGAFYGAAFSRQF